MSNTANTTSAQVRLGELNDTQLRELAPAIFANKPAADVSKRYTFVGTAEVLPALRDHGFVPVNARQRRGAGITGQHRVELFHRNHLDKLVSGKLESAPRIILENSHDRTRRLSAMAGYYRMVCSNGMVVASGMANGFVATHISLDAESIRTMIGGMAKLLDESQDRVEAFRERKLSKIEQSTYARFAVEARYKGYADLPIEPSEVLVARRDIDKHDDLWTVFNRVQENIVKGGISTIRGRRSRGVTSFYMDTVVNRRLWAGAEALLSGGTHGLQKFRKEMLASN
jgi:hypothetical protein